MPHAAEDVAWSAGEPSPGLTDIATAPTASGRPTRRARGTSTQPRKPPLQEPPPLPRRESLAGLEPLGSITCATAAAPLDVLDGMPPQVRACLAASRSDPAVWPTARAWLRGLPLATLRQALHSPMLRNALPRLVPLLKVSDVIPCLQGPGMVERMLPWLDPSQCKLLGPELATLIAPALHLSWTKLAHLPLETVVLIPVESFLAMPTQVLKQLPDAHRRYVAPYVKHARKVSHEQHDLALAEGLCEVLHLYTHKVLDPEHIPDVAQLRAVQCGGSLRAEIQALRWLVGAVMTDAVKAIQLGPLKLTTLIVALRKAGLRGLAGELDRSLTRHQRSRGQRYAADGVAYREELATAVQHARASRDADLADALNDAFRRHAGLVTGGRGDRDEHPLPSHHYVPIISVELAAANPPATEAAWQALEAVLHAQLGEPRNAVAIQEVEQRWADATTLVYRRHAGGGYLPA